MTILEAAAAWDASMAAWGASANTRASRRRLLVCLHDSHGWRDLDDITRLDVERFMGAGDYKPWTRATYFSYLRAFYAWAIESGVATTDPTAAMRRPKSTGTKPKPITQTEVFKVLDHADPQIRAYILLALYAGLRAHEIAKFQGDHITEQSIFVLGKGGKEAYIDTHPKLWDLAQSYPRTGYWFPSTRQPCGHVVTQTVTNSIARHFRDCGIDSGSIHRCRHTFATNLLRQGVNIRVVQDLMRHSSLATTQIYLEVSSEERRDAVRLLA